MDKSKATQQGDIPTKIVKDDKDIFSYFISARFNNAVNKGVFPNELKHADIKPIYKKESRNEKEENYRPVSILPNLSKIFERCMYDQLKDYFDKLLSNISADLEKGLVHLIAKLHAYGIKEGSLNLLFSYFKNRKEMVRLNNTYSEWIDILFGVPQGSILGPLLFNIFLCDLFLFLHDTPVASYADDNTPYCTGLKISDVLIKLENAAETLLQWFKDNRMKANPDKYHLLINNTKESFQIKIGNETVSNSKYEKLLEVKIDHELNFNEHVSSLCKKASQKLNALSRIASFMTFNQRRLILNSFITSHFSYCPIVRMFHGRKLNERINHIHKRALRIVYKDFNSSFQELLIEDNSLNIHHRNLQKLVTEIFKVKNGLSPELMNDVFEFIEKPYSLRTTSHFRSRKIRTTKCCIELHRILTLATNYGTLFQMNIKLLNQLQILRQK